MHQIHKISSRLHVCLPNIEATERAPRRSNFCELRSQTTGMKEMSAWGFVDFSTHNKFFKANTTFVWNFLSIGLFDCYFCYLLFVLRVWDDDFDVLHSRVTPLVVGLHNLIPFWSFNVSDINDFWDFTFIRIISSKWENIIGRSLGFPVIRSVDFLGSC